MPFIEEERALLLSAPGVGPMVIARLEAAGIESLRALRQVGVEQAIAQVCTQIGTAAWRNRQAALLGVLQRRYEA